MLMNYSTTDINIFLSKAEQRLVSLGEELIVQVTYGDVEEELLTKIELLTAILDGINDTTDQKEIDVLVYFALDYFNLAEIAYSPFSILPTTVIGAGGSGVSSWDELLDKPSTFPPSPHIHPDEQVIVDLTGITEFRDRFNSTFTGTLEKFIETLMIKYQPPTFTSFNQNKGTSFEIGQSISGTMNFSWGISSPTSVKNSTSSGSITISEAFPFTSNTTFNLYGSSGITRQILDTNYKKDTPGSLTFTLNGIDSKNQSMSPIATSLTWYSRIWYGNNVEVTVDATIVQTTFNSILTNTRQVSFTITGSGYKYVFIPENIDVTGIIFKSGQFSVAMNAPTIINVTNSYGVVLRGKLYRTKNTLGGDLTVTIQ